MCPDGYRFSSVISPRTRTRPKLPSSVRFTAPEISETVYSGTLEAAGLARAFMACRVGDRTTDSERMNQGVSTMQCKTGAEHIESLKDGRTVYLDGALVADVTTHPAFRNAVASAASLYDYQAA